MLFTLGLGKVGTGAGGDGRRHRGTAGWFEFDVPSGAWSWSASLFQIHGFEPGQIVPTTEIFVSHKHPQDRQHTDEVLAAVLATGQPLCCRHRIITAQQQVRTVVTIGRGELVSLIAVVGSGAPSVMAALLSWMGGHPPW